MVDIDVICFFFQAEDGIRDLVRSRGLGDVYKRQAGMLAKSKEKSERRRDREPLKESAKILLPQIEQYEKLCKKIGERPADVALAWVLSNPVVTSPIIGPRTQAQLHENVKALDLSLIHI